MADSGSIGIGKTPDSSYKLDVDGDIQANAYYYSSDVRLKKDIREISEALDKIKKLRGVSFSWKGNGEKSMGFIAQEVEKVLPELVNSDSKGYKAVQYGNLTALLLEGIREQEKIIEGQEQRIRNLEERLDRLEKGL